MSVKRMSLRFNLDNESDRRAWEHLQSIPDSKNKAVIDALNASFEQVNALADLIRQTIREFTASRIYHGFQRSALEPGNRGTVNPVSAFTGAGLLYFLLQCLTYGICRVSMKRRKRQAAEKSA